MKEEKITEEKSFQIPPEGSLGLLAVGAVGLRAWRKARAETDYEEKLLEQSKATEIEMQKKLEELKAKQLEAKAKKEQEKNDGKENS